MEDERIKLLMRSVNPRLLPLSGRTVFNYLKKKFVVIDSSIKSELKAMHVVICTSDAWPDEQSNSYLSITVHNVNTVRRLK